MLGNSLSLLGAKVVTHEKVRKGVYKITNLREKEEVKCPHVDQIRTLAFHHHSAKGPIYARSLQRKLLANEEFCLQLDAHSRLADGWDEGLQQQWRATHNEFGVISTVPPFATDFDKLKPGAPMEAKVPRQCALHFQDNGVPNYDAFMKSPDKLTYMYDVSEPLLSHGWSAAFSFAKCHLEEAAPYDPFLYFAKPIEQFGRYARMWTRGYDVYTPTRNYVFHNYDVQTNGHGNDEWFKRQKDRFRNMAIDRTKLFLEMPLSEEPENIEADRANLGIYGLGQRRSLEQLQQFTNIQFAEKKGNAKSDGICTGHTLVQFDAAISPVANLKHNTATKLDMHPLFPLRTKPVFPTSNVASADAVGDLSLDTENLEIAVENPDSEGKPDSDGASVKVGMNLISPIRANSRTAVGAELMEQTNLPPPSILFVLWIVGLIMWFFAFSANTTKDSKEWGAKMRASTKKKARKPRKTKIVKDV